jgi:hypothetical protein
MKSLQAKMGTVAYGHALLHAADRCALYPSEAWASYPDTGAEFEELGTSGRLCLGRKVAHHLQSLPA